MKLLSYIFILFSASLFSQEKIEVNLLEKQPNDKAIISINNFKTSYSLTNNTLTKKDTENNFNYSNIQLGEIASINPFNPLKINVFYKDFNTVVILDNRLAEIFKIDFNTNQDYKNISFVSTGGDNTIWVFNQDTQQLELFDYKNNKTRANTQPIQNEVLDIKSDYNYCWLITKTNLYKFNYFGILISKLKNNDFTEIVLVNENLILRKQNKLFYLKNNTTQPIELKLPKLFIKAFFANDETLYIYDNEFLYKYQIKTS